MRMNDPLTWVLIIGFTAATLAVLFGGPHVLAPLGVPFPHAISGLATGLLLILAIPLGHWSARRSAARIESGEQ
jgi:membrane associated rhomboid family serine protease